eukprot:Gregarina_sp_Poly_1__3820@NODE_213_length_11325_cov_357_800853_g189_i0_p6_GENE_NODE_213_length_11325_cov_357_800853_g189_i0NODE_213_length_11325_cov_357_800853_g189_i0_p6_ORF_typecomplete_len135_score11_09ToxSHH/PF15652_6/0_1_NODE_213_length_11325_cov_357_800853_g189_i059386342
MPRCCHSAASVIALKCRVETNNRWSFQVYIESHHGNLLGPWLRANIRGMIYSRGSKSAAAYGTAQPAPHVMDKCAKRKKEWLSEASFWYLKARGQPLRFGFNVHLPAATSCTILIDLTASPGDGLIVAEHSVTR